MGRRCGVCIRALIGSPAGTRTDTRLALNRLKRGSAASTVRASSPCGSRCGGNRGSQRRALGKEGTMPRTKRTRSRAKDDKSPR